MITGARIIYNRLIKHNVKTAFIYSGGAIMDLIDCFSDKQINYFINNHEQNSGHAATAYARKSGKVGVCVTTSGPGVTNMITPLLDAKMDSTPILLITGQVSRKSIGTNAFQECPAIELTKHATKYSYQIKTRDEIETVMDEAFHICQNGKKGSVHIDIPKDILSESDKPKDTIILKRDCYYYEYANIDFVANLINTSQKPILYVGQGCKDSVDELNKFAIYGNIPVTTTLHAVGCFDETNPLSLKFLGMHGNPAANYAMQNSDLIIALGARFDDRTTGVIDKFAPNAKNIIYVNIDETELENRVLKNRNFYFFNMSCNYFLFKLNRFIGFRPRCEWFNMIKKWQEYKFSYRTDILNTQMVINYLDKYLLKSKRNYIITTGVGNHQMFSAQFITWQKPSIITSGSQGVMGVGLPFAIGAQIADPFSLVIDIDGDGSFNQTLADLMTIKRYNLPIKIFIMNDSSMTMVKNWEKMFYDSRYVATKLPTNPKYHKLAETFGIKGIICDDKNNLSEIIEFACEYKEAILCEFIVEPDMCFPLVAPGKALDDMMFNF